MRQIFWSICTIFFIFSQALYAEGKITKSKNFNLLKLNNSNLFRYTIKSKQADNDPNGFQIARNLAKKSGAPLLLQSEPIQPAWSINSISDPSSYLEIDHSKKSYFINAGYERYKGEQNTPNLLHQQKLLDMAFNHLTELGLQPKKNELEEPGISSINLAVHREDGTTNDYEKLMVVSFSRKLDGIPLKGRSRIILRMGENGQLQSLIHYWADFEREKLPISKNQLESDDVIEQKINKHLLKQAEKAQLVSVENADLVLYEDDNCRVEPAVFVQGVNSFEVDSVGVKKELKSNLDFYIPVLKSTSIVWPEDNTLPIPSNPEQSKE